MLKNKLNLNLTYGGLFYNRPKLTSRGQGWEMIRKDMSHNSVISLYVTWNFNVGKSINDQDLPAAPTSSGRQIPTVLMVRGVTINRQIFKIYIRHERIILDGLAYAPKPSILHWNQNHFVVLCKTDGKARKFYIADPDKCLLTYSHEEMTDHWINTRMDGSDKGVVMLVAPTLEFSPCLLVTCLLVN